MNEVYSFDLASWGSYSPLPVAAAPNGGAGTYQRGWKAAISELPMDPEQTPTRAAEDPIPPAARQKYAFAGFELDLGRGTLERGGVDIKLRPKSYELLCMLVQQHGRLVTKEEILEAVWRGAAVSDDTITQSILDIRRALGDSDQTIVQTVPRRGYRLNRTVEPVAENTSKDANSAATRRAASIIGVAALLFVIVWAGSRWNESATTTAGVAGDPSIAVLPFLDLTAEKDLGYFADGVSEEILNSLAQIPKLRVIARTSSFYFKNHPADIATIGERLSVSHVLEGSVRRSDDVIRITAQLIDVATEEHIWSQNYHHVLGDVFAVQDDISASVLDLFLSSIDRPVDPERTVDSEAYRLYLQARELIDKGDESVDDAAERFLRRALEIDGSYGPAWRELARLHWRAIGTGASLSLDIRKTRRTLDEAMKHAPDDAGVIAYDAWHKADFHGDFAAAAAGLERALKISPNHEDALRVSVLFAHAIGDFEDAIALGEYAVDNSPMCSMCYYNLATIYRNAGLPAESIATVRRFQELFPGAHGQLAVSLLLDGRPQEAMSSFAKNDEPSWRLWGSALSLHALGRSAESREAAESLRAMPMNRSTLRLVAMLHAWKGELDAAFAALTRFIELTQKRVDGSGRYTNIWVGEFVHSALFQNLHDDPRWAALLADLALADEDLEPVRARYLGPPAGWTRSALIEDMLRGGDVAGR